MSFPYKHSLLGLVTTVLIASAGCKTPAPKATPAEAEPSQNKTAPAAPPDEVDEVYEEEDDVDEEETTESKDPFDFFSSEPEKPELPLKERLLNASAHLTGHNFLNRNKEFPIINLRRSKNLKRILRKGRYRLGLFELPYQDIVLNIPAKGVRIKKTRLRLKKNLTDTLPTSIFNPQKKYSILYYKVKGNRYVVVPVKIGFKQERYVLSSVYCLQKCYLEGFSGAKYLLREIAHGAKIRKN